jgi:hypothetical protein
MTTREKERSEADRNEERPCDFMFGERSMKRRAARRRHEKRKRAVDL